METRNQVTRALKLVLLVTLIIIVSFLVASYFFAMALGLELFFFTQSGLAFSNFYYIRPPVYLFFIFAFNIPTYINVGLIFAFLWGVFLFCFVAAWKLRESFHEVIKNSFSRPISHTLKNFLFAMPIITSMLLTAVIAIHSFQEAHGVPTGEPPLPEDPMEKFFVLTYVVVMEEIGFRITPIGAFLVFYVFLVGIEKARMESWGQRLKVFFLAWLYPEKAKKMLGLKTVGDSGVRGGISLAEWIMVLLTSAIFGLVHYLGGGWEVGKITSVFVQGFAMGLTYLIYGIHAPILIHWFFDYYGYVYYEIALNTHPETFLLVSIVDRTTIILGRIGWIVVAVLGILWAVWGYRKENKFFSNPKG